MVVKKAEKLFFEIYCTRPGECSGICVSSGEICKFLQIKAIKGTVLKFSKKEGDDVSL